MSYTDVDVCIKAVLPEVDGIEPSTMKLVLIAIAMHTNAKRDDHTAYPSLDTLVGLTQLSRSAVSRAVDALDRLKMFDEYIVGAGRRSSFYRLNIEALKSVAYDPSVLRENATSNSQSSLRDTQSSSETPQGSCGTPQGSSEERSVLSDAPNRVNPVLNLDFNKGLNIGTPLRGVSPTPLQDQVKDEPGKPGNPARGAGLVTKQRKVKTAQPCSECLGEHGDHHKSCKQHPENVFAAAAAMSPGQRIPNMEDL